MPATFGGSFQDSDNTSSWNNTATSEYSEDLTLPLPSFNLPPNNFASYLNWPDSPTLPGHFRFERTDTMSRNARAEGSQRARTTEVSVNDDNNIGGNTIEPEFTAPKLSRAIDISFIEKRERSAGAKMFSANWPTVDGKSISDGRRGAISGNLSQAPRRRKRGKVGQKRKVDDVFNEAMAELTIDEESSRNARDSWLWSDSDSGSDGTCAEDDGNSGEPSGSNLETGKIDRGRPMRSGSPVKKETESLKDRIDRIMLYGIDGREELLWYREAGYRSEMNRVESMESIAE